LPVTADSGSGQADFATVDRFSAVSPTEGAMSAMTTITTAPGLPADGIRRRWLADGFTGCCRAKRAAVLRAIHAVLIVAAVLVISACRSDQMYTVESAPLNPPPKATMADIQRAIIRAGATRGWVMTPKEPGLVQATYSRQGHSATVDIRYSMTSYSIGYVDSQNLNYDGSNIHPRYNSWVRNLQTDIQNQVAAI
jgi:hypothetical protein